MTVVLHYSDVIMSAMTSQITGVSIVCSLVGSGADQRKHQSSASLHGLCEGNPPVTDGLPSQRASKAENVSIWLRHNVTFLHAAVVTCICSPYNCPACRTTLVATRFRVAVICPIIQVPHCIRVFFYFVWFVFINHIFQFYYELCTYCTILDIYLS